MKCLAGTHKPFICQMVDKLRTFCNGFEQMGYILTNPHSMSRSRGGDPMISAWNSLSDHALHHVTTLANTEASLSRYVALPCRASYDSQFFFLCPLTKCKQQAQSISRRGAPFRPKPQCLAQRSERAQTAAAKAYLLSWPPPPMCHAPTTLKSIWANALPALNIVHLTQDEGNSSTAQAIQDAAPPQSRRKCLQTTREKAREERARLREWGKNVQHRKTRTKKGRGRELVICFAAAFYVG